MRTPFNLMDCDNITNNNINQSYNSKQLGNELPSIIFLEAKF